MWQKSKPYLLVLPAVLVICVLFFGGLIDGLIKSFGYFPAIGMDTFTLSHYEETLRSSEFWTSFILTFRIALFSTVLAGIVGLTAAIWIYFAQQNAPGRLGITRLFQLPLTIPHLAAGYIMLLLLSQSGFISRIFYSLGLTDVIDEFPVLTNDHMGIGIILTYAWKEAPFVALLIYPVLARVHQSWRDTAKVYGASTLDFIRYILLPAVFPAFLMATFIVFVYTFSAFEVPYLLGVTYPNTLPVYAYQLYTSGDFAERPEALAVTWILTLITFLIGSVAYFFYRSSNQKGWE